MVISTGLKLLANSIRKNKKLENIWLYDNSFYGNDYNELIQVSLIHGKNKLRWSK